MNVIRSEWRKLMRPGMVLGGALLVAVAALGAFLVFVNAVAQPDPKADAMAFSFARLQQPDGLVASILLIGQLIGAVSMVIFARSFGNDYTNGTLKVALTREPRRARFLGGKLVALSAFVTISVVLGFLVMTGVAATIAANRGIDTSQWWTGTGLADSAGGLGRLVVASLIWGLIGVTLGILTRSGSLAVGIGLPAIVIGEHVLQRFWNDGAKWMPGIVTSAFAAGGTADWSLAAATTLSMAYAAVLVLASAGTFIRRDVA